MRSLLLASAALCLTAGVAMAQVSSSSPAPTGAPQAAPASPAPGASPGNMAPASGTQAGSTGMSGMSANNPPAPTTATGGLTGESSATTATTPHYNGQNEVSPPAGQATAEGAAGGTAGNGSMGMNSSSGGTKTASSVGATGYSHSARSYGGAMSLPENATPGAYLKIASKAIKQHDKMLADEALSHAETRMLTRAVPASSGAAVDDSPGVTAIEHAREALASGDYDTAASDTRMAMHDRHGMMGGPTQ